MYSPERTKVTKNEIAARWAMFGPSPVLSSENRDGYDNLRNACVAYYRPTDARHWAWVRELVDTQWEILRHWRYRTAAIEQSHKDWIRNRRKLIDQILQKPKDEIRELLPHCDNEIVRNRVASIKTYIADVEALVEKAGQPDDAKHSLALARAAKYVERLDKWLKNATARRNILLRILEYFCRPADQKAEIAEADYKEAKQEEVKKIAAPSVVPPDLVIGDITTVDQPETVACAKAATDMTIARN